MEVPQNTKKRNNIESGNHSSGYIYEETEIKTQRDICIPMSWKQSIKMRYVYTYTYIRTYIHTCTHIYIHIYTCIHICT
jgi:hypothetical protein